MADAASKSQHQSDLASLALDKLEEKLGVVGTARRKLSRG